MLNMAAANASDYAEDFEAAGWEPLSNYKSSLNTGLAGVNSSNIQFVEDYSYVGEKCYNNSGCNHSTFCCSKKKCVPGSICYNGQKQVKDYCDYHFECLTRCCSPTTGKCTHFYECYSMCSTNADCTTGCCSFGYCSHQSVCKSGQKVLGDQCESDSECRSDSDGFQESVCVDGRCTPHESTVSAHFVTMTAVVIMSASALTVLVYCCFQCCCGDKSGFDSDSDDMGYRSTRGSLTRPLLNRGEESGWIGGGPSSSLTHRRVS